MMIFISNNPLVAALAAAAIIGLFGWAWRAWHNRKDSKAIYDFLVTSKSGTSYSFRSTEAISSHTKIPEERAAMLCSRHPNIRRNEMEKQSWALVD